MRRAIIIPVFNLLVILLALAAPPSATVAADRYDVSYVWSGDLAAVQNYRERVVRVLGPGVAKDLKVVSNGKLYGVVYERHGDSAGATRVAKSHTRLLRASGLDAASPMPSGNWTIVGVAEPKRASIKSLPRRVHAIASRPPVRWHCSARQMQSGAWRQGMLVAGRSTTSNRRSRTTSIACVSKAACSRRAHRLVGIRFHHRREARHDQ